MAGNCLEKLPHSCGTTDGLQVFAKPDGEVDGYCFACHEYVENPYGEVRSADSFPQPNVKSEEEIKNEIEEISNLSTFDVKVKKLRKDTLEHFGIKVALSEEDGKTPTMMCYPYYKEGNLVGYKLKVLSNKRMWAVGSLKDAEPFGWDLAIKSGARNLIITEGEDDAVAWTRALEMYSNREYKDLTVVISLPSGSGSAKNTFAKFGKMFKANFRKVFLSFDMDEPGRKAVEEVFKIDPSVLSLDIPCKDANECIIQGKAKALFNCLFQEDTKPKNTRLITGGSVWDNAAVQAEWGQLSWPWNHIQQETRGIRFGEVIYIGAGVKMGKTEFLDALAVHFIMKHDVPILLAKLEQSVPKLIKRLAGKAVGKIFDDPTVEFDYEAFQEAKRLLKPDTHVHIVDRFQHVGWESLKQDIIAAAQLGVKAVFIDPVTNLVAGVDSGDANTLLEKIAKDCSILADDLQITIFITCHLKAHDGFISRNEREKKYQSGTYIGLGNCAHEQGGDIYSQQFHGSRAMMRACNMMIGIEGNKDPELDDIHRRMRHIKILEDREFNATGIFPLMYSEVTQLYSEA